MLELLVAPECCLPISTLLVYAIFFLRFVEGEESA